MGERLTKADKPDGVTDKQWRDWLNDLAGMRSGNPYATMCRYCSGRHGPPRDHDCPRAALQSGASDVR